MRTKNKDQLAHELSACLEIVHKLSDKGNFTLVSTLVKAAMMAVRLEARQNQCLADINDKVAYLMSAVTKLFTVEVTPKAGEEPKLFRIEGEDAEDAIDNMCESAVMDKDLRHRIALRAAYQLRVWEGNTDNPTGEEVLLFGV